jgi:hypothetical protein
MGDYSGRTSPLAHVAAIFPAGFIHFGRNTDMSTTWHDRAAVEDRRWVTKAPGERKKILLRCAWAATVPSPRPAVRTVKNVESACVPPEQFDAKRAMPG